jgi:hypothetical protein
MSRSTFFCLMLFSWFLFISANAWSAVQVVYVVEGNTIVTYNVDPQTLNATQVGSLNINGSAEYYGLFPSADDHFLYLVAFNSNSTKTLSVYATDASGAPQAPATQQFNANYFYGIQFDPRANFAYAVYGLPYDAYNTAYHIFRYVVDPKTGKLSNRVSEATYILSNGAEGSTYCEVGLYGFNPAATTLYDVVSCSGHDGGDYTYYERTLNTKTGALGPDVQIYSWSYGTEGRNELIQFVGSHMFDFVTPNNYQTGANSLDIYPLVPNTSKPQIHCTSTMLAACGAGPGVAHPSGQYLLMWTSQTTTEVDKVEFSQRKIADTGNYIPYANATFGPGGTLIYAANYAGSGYSIEIYGFNATTGAVTPGGSISVPSGLDSYYAVKRH